MSINNQKTLANLSYYHQLCYYYYQQTQALLNQHSATFPYNSSPPYNIYPYRLQWPQFQIPAVNSLLGSSPSALFPTPSDPTLIELTATEPNHFESTPIAPTPSESTPTESTPSESTPSESTPSEPTHSKPTRSKPTLSTPTSDTIRMARTPNTAERLKQGLAEGSLETVGNLKVQDLFKMMQESTDKIMAGIAHNYVTQEEKIDMVSDITDLQETCNELQKQTKSLRKELESLKFLQQRDHKVVIRIADKDRRRNAIFKNVAEIGSPKQSVLKICTDIMGLQDVEIVRANVIYKTVRKICVFVEFKTDEQAQAVFDNLAKLALTGIMVSRDINEQRQEHRMVMYSLRALLRASGCLLSISMRDDHLKVGESKLFWDTNKKLMCHSGENGIEVLEELLSDTDFNAKSIDYDSLLQKGKLRTAMLKKKSANN